MEIFLVGGAVRDFLLAKMEGLFKTHAQEEAYWAQVEKDWVVVGSTPQEMIKLGFRPVGKSFPVFLHPDTQEEYALARTERKTGKGYTAFECYASENVTLADDLKRRDLTINAIAAPADLTRINFDTVIDPHHGVTDLKYKIFRHVSDAFVEDPVRILRLARLSSRWGNFKVHPTTQQLMQEMVRNGEVDALVAERVWQEWSRSLQEPSPWRFFETLQDCQAIDRLFPGMQNFAFKRKVLQCAMQNHSPAIILLAIQLFDLQEHALRTLTQKYRIPSAFRALALLVAQFYPLFKEADYTPKTILQWFEKADAFRRPERFAQCLITCGYLGQGTVQARLDCLQQLLNKLQKIDHAPFLAQGLTGIKFAQALQATRLHIIEQSLRD